MSAAPLLSWMQLLLCLLLVVATSQAFQRLPHSPATARHHYRYSYAYANPRCHTGVTFTTSACTRTFNPRLFMSSNSPTEPPSPPEFNFPNPLSVLAKSPPSDRSADLMVGEDAAVFDWDNEKMEGLGERGWASFFAAVGAILTAVAVLWVYPPTGYADDFQAALEAAAGGNSHLVTLFYGIIFPIVHSGLASLRPFGEQVIGARAWRVVFAFPSLCLSYSWITYFIAHVHDGYQFYDISGIPWVHASAWIINFVSFLFLYPSVFNLKEVAAVEKPAVHLWETGVIRITRHPQFVGQAMWSLAHLAMVGTTFSLLTQALLVGHHAFACWNGDRRLLAYVQALFLLPFVLHVNACTMYPNIFISR